MRGGPPCLPGSWEDGVLTSEGCSESNQVSTCTTVIALRCIVVLYYNITIYLLASSKCPLEAGPGCRKGVDMHTSRYGKTDLPPPFRQAGTMRGDGPTLSICLRCRDGRENRNTDLDQRGGRRLAQLVADAFPDSTAARWGIRLRGVNCMSNCNRSCTIALSAPGRFTYLFGDLDPTLHAGDVLSVAAAYAEAEGGYLPRPVRPKVLRAGILGRIPPLGFAGDPVEPLSPTPQHSTHGSDNV